MAGTDSNSPPRGHTHAISNSSPPSDNAQISTKMASCSMQAPNDSTPSRSASSSESDTSPDQDEASDQVPDDFIGISMSKTQTVMRSPTTPAIDKTRALETSYFEGFDSDPPSQSLDGDVSRDGSTASRSRADTAGHRMSSQQEHDDQTSAQEATRSERVPTGNSIYLNRKTTSISTYDDTSKFSDVKDMANARFKAISDSLQNSSLKMPKMPSITVPDLLRRKSSDKSTQPVHEDERRVDKGEPPHDPPTVRPHSSQASHDHAQGGNTQHKSHPILTETLSKLKGDIVVLGGYRGSILRSADPPHRQLWIPVKVGLNLRKVDLELGLKREDEERAHETIIPDCNLSHVGPVDVSRRLLKIIRKSPNSKAGELRLHDWGWDWRLSPDLTSTRLERFLESLPCNQPDVPPEQRGAIVIAHSLGGLVTRHVVNRRPELFSGVVYAGTPQNAVNILGPLRMGDQVLLSTKVLTAQVNFSFRTSYLMLPEDGRCFVQRDTNKRLDVDFFDPKTWEKHCLSPCVNSPLDPQSRQPIQQELRRDSTDRRKSLIGSITETISNALPSRKGSLFGGSREVSTSSTSDGSANTNGSTSSTSNKEDNYLHDPESPPTDLPMTSSPPTSEAPSQPVNQSLQPSMNPQSQNMSSSSAQAKSTTAAQSHIPREEAFEYLDRTLKQTKEFKRLCQHNARNESWNLYPPHSIIFSKSVPTVFGARVADEEAIKYTDAYDDLIFAAGDGVVLASAAQLPQGYRYVKDGRVESDRGHVGLLGDLEGIGTCLNAVWEARRKGVGLGVDRISEGDTAAAG